MKFFSNEAARQGDETYDEDRARAEAQGTVPQQRAGSPWSAAPGDTHTETEEQDRRDDSAVVDYSHASERTDQERDYVRDDADRTVVIDTDADRRNTGVADRRDADLTDDREGDVTDRHDADVTDRHDADVTDRHDADADVTDRHDADVTDRMAGTSPDTTSDSEPTADVRTASDDRAPDDGSVDLALDDDKRTTSTTTYGPDGAVTEEKRPVEDAAIRDEGTFDSPTVVEPDSGEPVEAEQTAAESADASSTDASAPVAAESKPAAEPATELKPAAVDETPDRLFPEGDDLADRFRDIQLRFVDNPKEATAEAATLVDDALDKLIAALKSRRGDLSSNSDDTEKLRVELRGYRELLNRVLKL
jgi:hypothetical protein